MYSPYLKDAIPVNGSLLFADKPKATAPQMLAIHHD